VAAAIVLSAWTDLSPPRGPLRKAPQPRGTPPACPAPGSEVVVLHVSDIHVSERSNTSLLRFERLLTEIAPLVDPDAVVVTGDLTDNKLPVGDLRRRGRIDSEWAAYQRAVRKGRAALPRAALLDMTGNHDRFGGGSLAADEPQGRGFAEFGADSTLGPGPEGRRGGSLRSGGGAGSGGGSPAPAVRRRRRHRSLDVRSRDGATALRLLAVDATVDPAPTRHFFGRVSAEDVGAVDALAAAEPRPDVSLMALHYPLCTVGHESEPPMTGRAGWAESHPLARVARERGVAAVLSGHLHQLPMGELSSSAAGGRPLHGLLPGSPAPLELEVPDARRHGVYRVLVAERDGRTGFAEPRVAPQGRGAGAAGSAGRPELPVVVLTSPADARYLRGFPGEAAPSITGVAFAGRGSVVSAEWRVLGPDGAPATPWTALGVASNGTSHRLCGAIGPAAVAAVAAMAGKRRAPSAYEQAWSSSTSTPGGAGSGPSSDTLPWTSAPGFPVLEVRVAAGAPGGGPASVAVARRPLSLDGTAAPLPWQRLMSGSVRATVGVAAARALLVLAGAGMLPPLLLRGAGVWDGEEGAEEGGSSLPAMAARVWGPVDSLWRHFTPAALALLAWCVVVLPAGPWLAGELLPGRPTLLFAWGHVYAATAGDCAAHPGWCLDLSSALRLGFVPHDDSPLYLVRAYSLVAAPLLSLLGMAAAAADGGRPGLLGPRRRHGCLWAVTGAGLGGVSRPAGATGLFLLAVSALGLWELASTVVTHHGVVAGLLSFGLVWPPLAVWLLAAWLVCLDAGLLLRELVASGDTKVHDE